jgi:hypothetical protein
MVAGMNAKHTGRSRRRLHVLGLFTLVLAGALLGGLFLAPSARADTAGFPDVPSSYAYHVQVEVLNQLGVIEGFGDGTFRPKIGRASCRERV